MCNNFNRQFTSIVKFYSKSIITTCACLISSFHLAVSVPCYLSLILHIAGIAHGHLLHVIFHSQLARVRCGLSAVAVAIRPTLPQTFRTLYTVRPQIVIAATATAPPESLFALRAFAVGALLCVSPTWSAFSVALEVSVASVTSSFCLSRS